MFTRIRWLSIVVPVILVAGIELISDTLLDAQMPFPLDTVLVAIVVFGCAVTLSWLAFRQIDGLTRTLEGRNAELAVRTATARGLQDTAVRVATASELRQTLRAVVTTARGLLRADVAVLAIDAWGVGRLRLVDPPALMASLHGNSEAEINADLAAAGFAMRVARPVRLGSATAGILMTAGGARQFEVDDVETLSALAGMAGVAIRNEQQRGTLRELAVRGERERIAREMHDGLAQVLAYVSAKSAAADEFLAAGRPDDARAQMAQLGAAARSTYVDVREAILGLTTPVDAEHGLVGALEQYASRFAEASKIAVLVSASPDARAAHLAPETEAQAFRIVQEALTNVRKHADASRIDLSVDLIAGRLLVAVQDDGRGLPVDGPAAGEWPHYGQTTMVARAAEVGGNVTWSSSDRGTRVELHVPLPRPGDAPPHDLGTSVQPAGTWVG